MRKAQKRQALDFTELLGQAHGEIKNQIEGRRWAEVLGLLEQCQQGAIELGNLIEATEGSQCPVISALVKYCEIIYQFHEKILQGQAVYADRVYRDLQGLLSGIEKGIMHDIKIRTEAVFLPYKASMWDSLESVWMAAEADENCDAYVIPIPYYDKNPDGSFCEMHYEGTQYPDYVPITWYKDYDFEKHRPDMIFIHNPYDEFNYVTSVPPFFYSKNLKQFTDLLVYIPYYSTAGGMSEAQYQCLAYYNADYIVIQAEKFRRFFDAALPEEKFLILGSPKFDKIVRLCSNPPEIPEPWKAKITGKKVYFYNTSIGGMLANTDVFLKKMEYVFRCFEERTDACLMWRPHPLLESTFASMRPGRKMIFDSLKKNFIEKDYGIYDDTPDIAETISHCDAYIGDAGTSVTSLFGIAGKPLFILNDNIDCAPDKDDWRGEVITSFSIYGDNDWMITQGNKLYHSQKKEGQYRYFCDLSAYSYGYYYSQVISIEKKHYVCPINAQDIIVLGDKKIEKKIGLQPFLEQQGAFWGAISYEKYLLLIPNRYPAIVKYDTEKEELHYYTENLNVFVKEINGAKQNGGFCVQNGCLYLTSPVDNQVLILDIETGKEQIAAVNTANLQGCMNLVSDGEELWFLPYAGNTVIRWKPETGEVREYRNYPSGMKCRHPVYGYECMEKPFSGAAFNKDFVIFSPCWANMYVCLDRHSGEMTEWKPAFFVPEKVKNGYFASSGRSYFFQSAEDKISNSYHLFSIYDRRLYRIHFESGEWEETDIEFDPEELRENEPGFQEESQWLQYVCRENAFVSLPDFLDGNIAGKGFDRERQILSYHKIAANHDGTCGEKIYQTLCGRL